MTKFVNRQNENVRVEEDSLTKDVRFKHSNQGRRLMRGPMKVPVEEDDDQGMWDQRCRKDNVSRCQNNGKNL